jgi:pantoate--beta-alanine ligase
MQILPDPASMSAWSRRARSQGETIGFVPTMGYLHDGHLSLMRIARPLCDRLVVSIFVNPIQFGPHEDLDRYPRDEQGDLAKCRAERVDAVFLPSPQNMYPAGFQTTLSLGSLAAGLCGASRPGHFEGAATVVLKMFNLVRPAVAVFGQKDFQQLAVMRRMVRDLDLDIDVRGGPIVREPDGVAMSSRNANLTPAQRAQATALSTGLSLVERLVADGERSTARLRAAIAEHVGRPVAAIERPTLLALAVRFGGTRLIDNRVLRP